MGDKHLLFFKNNICLNLQEYIKEVKYLDSSNVEITNSDLIKFIKNKEYNKIINKNEDSRTISKNEFKTGWYSNDIPKYNGKTLTTLFDYTRSWIEHEDFNYIIVIEDSNYILIYITDLDRNNKLYKKIEKILQRLHKW